MKFNILKTRNGKLRNKLSNNFPNNKLTEKDIDLIMFMVDDYEKANLLTIEKLKKEKVIESKRISGALKQTIHAHGPITKEFIGSATKRIYGSLLNNEKKESFIDKLKKFFTKWIN
jgi:uncharacterized membrane-anchored protein YjiN (DUF445 family)